jgi:hypothetical protein
VRVRTARELELGVGVGTDFAVQVDFFVLRSGPFHGRKLLETKWMRASEEYHGELEKERYKAGRGNEPVTAPRGEQVTKDIL